MSALGQKRTSPFLFDHLVGATLYRLRHGNAECFGGLEVDIQLEFSRLLDRQVSRLIALENPASIIAGQAVRFRRAPSVAQQTSSHDELPTVIDRRHSVADRQRSELFASACKKWFRGDHEPARSQLDQLREDLIEVTFGACIQDMELQPESASRCLQFLRVGL